LGSAGAAIREFDEYETRCHDSTGAGLAEGDRFGVCGVMAIAQSKK